MTRPIRPPIGLLGRIVAILLITLIIEFGASTLLYERASQFAVRDDEARRLAEHLVISRRLINERPAADRATMATQLTTERYAIRWSEGLSAPPPIVPALEAMRAQVVAWEPTLTTTDLRLRLTSPGRSSVVTGGLRLPDRSWLYFRTLEPVTNLNLAYRRVQLALIPAIALMILGGILVRHTLLPLRRLAAAADKVGSGAGGEVAAVAEDGPGEVRRVVVAFNNMQARIQRLIADRTQALAAVGHDLRTPLARLRLRTEALHAPDIRAAIARDIDEMDAMVASLLAFLGGASDPEAPTRIDLAVLCATLVDDAIDRDRDADYVGPDHLEIVVRAGGLKRALANLVDNALNHGERMTVTLMSHPGAVAIRVEDDGPGIPADRIDTVIDPFVRLDAARRRDTVGFGLGLSIVAQVVEAEAGTLTLVNRPTGGLRAEIVLPRAA